ncbi:MAG: EF-hand domain-containing protein [Alphaproteobacteria bacterium]|nr:EF-hand domain-containing protein [Alphaproteobacteria bacterium]
MLKLVCLATTLLFAVPAFAAPDTASTPVKPAPAARGVMRFDANHDGAVDRDEWNAGQEARFKQLDTNGDGKLSQEELFAGSPAVRGNATPADRQAQRRAAYFRRLDRDNDGFVSKAEFMAQANQNFARCDLNKDERIDAAECRQALRRTPSQPAKADR